MKVFLLAWVAGILFVALGQGSTLPDASDLEARIIRLRQEVERHDDLYYRLAAPEISDHEYDELTAELRRLESLHPESSGLSSGATSLGDDRRQGLATHRHGARMLSLDKATSLAELRAFHESVTNRVGPDVSYWIEPKYDGIAVSLTYEEGHFVRATTRGNGREGNDITGRVRALGVVPEILGECEDIPVPLLIEIRGEIFMPLDRFEALNHSRAAGGEAPFASPRNLAAGSIQLADEDVLSVRGLKLVCYGWGDWQPVGGPPDTLGVFQEMLRQWGLPSVEDAVAAAGLESMISTVQAWDDLWGSRAYPSDGLVIKVAAAALQEQLGVGATAPRWAIAWKFPPARATTQLLDIQIQVGRTGAATPVALMETVELAGTSVSRASLFHAGNIARRDIRVGDVVVLERSGDSIPQVLGPVLEERRRDLDPYTFPAACPGCGVAWEAGDGGYRCGNRECPERILASFTHFVSAKAMAIRGMGPVTVATLLQHSKVTSPADLYALSREDFVGLPGIGERSATRLIAAIDESRSAPWAHVVNALGLPGIGAERARVLASVFPDLQSLAYVRCEQLETPIAEGGPGFSPTLAREVEAHLQDPMTQDLLYGLIAAGVGPSPIVLSLTLEDGEGGEGGP